MRRAALFRAAAMAALVLLKSSASAVFAAGTFAVTANSDSGVGSLRQALLDANAAGGGAINFAIGSNTITLRSPLPILATPLTINGNGAIVSGDTMYRIFFSDAPTGSTTNIANLTIRDARAVGGYGGDGGGGGGLGAGGGLFVGRGTVALTGVSFANNFVYGGHGGDGLAYTTGANHAGAGGGGLGGNGAIATPSSLFGGGGGGGGGLYGPAHANNGGGSDFSGTGTEGGTQFAPPSRYGGGAASANGQNGATYGGGGGGSIQAGRGGFGGGGGSGGAGANSTLDGHGGDGGFGGGGGGSGGLITGISSLNPGRSGAFAGATVLPNDSTPQSFYESELGGGGAALGANVFAAPFATVTFNDTSADQGFVTGGIGGRAATGSKRADNGSTAGSNVFLAGQTRINVSSGQTRRLAGAIDDVGDYINDVTAFGYDYASIVKGGDGTLTLAGDSDYRGGTVVSRGIINVATPTALGTGTLTLNDENTGASTISVTVGTEVGGFGFFPAIVVAPSAGTATLASAPTNAGAGRFFGAMRLDGSVTLLGQNATTLDAADTVGQTIFAGSVTGAGGITVAGGHMVQLGGINTYQGATHVTANSTLSIFNAASASPNSRVTIDAGSTLVLEGTFSGASFASLEGAGTLRGNSAVAASTLNLGQGATAATNHVFTGTITGVLAVNFFDPGAQTLSGQNNTTLTLNVNAGTLRFAGDARVAEADATKSSAGQQAIDLNGHKLGVGNTTIQIPGLIQYLNANISVSNLPASADGFYDATLADTRKAIGVAVVANVPTIRVTWKGDANLDLKVNFDDLILLAQNYNKTTNLEWGRGDFNRDGVVNFDDLIPLAQNYNVGGAPLGLPSDLSDDFGGNFASDWALAQALVPEPTCAAAFSGIALLGTRRRR